MTKHVVGKAEDIPPGKRIAVTVKGRPIVIFNIEGHFYGLLNRCPHQSAELAKGIVTGIAVADSAGDIRCVRPGEFIRCPWHGWEFDIRTGQSWCEPSRYAVKQFNVSVEAGDEIVKGPYKAETIPVTVEESYVVVDV